MSLILEKQIRNTQWKLNSNILNDPKILEKLKEDIKEYLEFNDSGEVSPIMVWDTLKAVMRGKVISITTYQKKLRGQRLANLQGKLKQLQIADSNRGNLNHKGEIKQLQKEIDDLYTLETQKRLLFLKQKNYEVGGKSAKLLAYKLHINRLKIRSIK